MFRVSLLRLSAAVFLSLPAFTPHLAQAQAKFADKPVRLVVPFSPGGATDNAARLLANELTTALGTQVLVDNRPGANGSIAAEAVAKSIPDGTTLFAATNTPMAANPYLYKSLPYDAIRDFAPLARVALVPYVLISAPELKANKLEDLLAMARKEPGKLSYATGAATGTVAGEALKRAASVDILQVPYKSNPPALTDVMSGRVSMMFTDIVSVIGQIQGNRVKALAVTMPKRSAMLPDVPTMTELGVKGMEIYGWSAIYAPVKTPAPQVARLSEELRKILARPDVQQKIAALGLEPAPGSAEELASFHRAELAKWEKLVKDAAIQPE
jgi:tripartite-type tricarboxylate transporter receptor subunit TctC